ERWWRTGRHASGVMVLECRWRGQWPARLKGTGPHRRRPFALRVPAVAAGIGQFAVIQSVAESVGVDVIPVDLSDAAELERELVGFAQSANGGLILTASALSSVHRDLIITLAARHRLPPVYLEPLYAH